MKSTEKFYREVHGAAAMALLKLQEGTALTASDVVYLSHAVEAVKEFACGLSERDKQAKARADRIQWIEAPNGIEVAKVGRGWAHYSYSRHNVLIFDSDGAQVARFETLAGTKGANRLIRAWRKKQ